jgi:hypothetical protein
LLRDLLILLNIEKFERLAVVDYSMGYSSRRRLPICTIVNLVNIGDAEIKISEEHLQYKWVSVDELENYKFRWERAIEWIRKGFGMRMDANTHE